MAGCTIVKNTKRIEKVTTNEITLKSNGDRDLDKAPRFVQSEEFQTNTKETIHLGPSFGPSKGGGGGASLFRSLGVKNSLASHLKKGDSVFLFDGAAIAGGLQSQLLKAAAKALGAKLDEALGGNEQSRERKERREKRTREQQQKELLKALGKSKIIVTRNPQELKAVSELMRRHPQIKPEKIVAFNVSPDSVPEHLRKKKLVAVAMASSKGLPKELRNKQGPLANLAVEGQEFRSDYKRSQDEKPQAKHRAGDKLAARFNESSKRTESSAIAQPTAIEVTETVSKPATTKLDPVQSALQLDFDQLSFSQPLRHLADQSKPTQDRNTAPALAA